MTNLDSQSSPAKWAAKLSEVMKRMHEMKQNGLEAEMIAIWLFEAAKEHGYLDEVRCLISYANKDADGSSEVVTDALIKFTSTWDECERSSRDDAFGNALGAAEQLDANGRAELVAYLNRGLAKRERARERIVSEVDEAEQEFETGQCVPMTAAEILREALS